MNFFKKRSTAWAVFAIAVVCSFFIGQAGRQVSEVEILPSGVYVQDKADLLSEETEKHITQINNGLVSAIGAEVQVAVVDSTDGKDIFDMAYDLAIDTNLSPRCCVFLVAVDDINAVIIQGDEVMYAIPNEFLDEIINRYFTVADFENRTVDFAVRNTFDRLIDRYEDYYGITVQASSTIQKQPQNPDDMTATVIGMVIFIILVILVCYIITRPRRRAVFVPTGTPRTRTYGRTNNYPPRGSYNTPPPYSGSSSRSGGFGSSSNRGGSFSSSSSGRSSRSGGFGSSSSKRGGSFSSRSSGSSFSSRSSSHSGGFGSGGSRGGSFGGGSRGGGFRK